MNKFMDMESMDLPIKVAKKPNSCYGCVYMNREYKCKINMKRKTLPNPCICACHSDDFVKNERTQRMIIKAKRVLIDTFRSDPIRFICDILEIENLKWYQKIILENLFKRLEENDSVEDTPTSEEK
jgi:hypothetical protein